MEGKDLLWMHSAIQQLLLAGTLLGISYAVRRYDETTSVRSNPVYEWALLVSLLLFVYIGGRFLNWIVFRIVSRLALVSFLSDAMFYCLALDDIVQHITWIIVGVS
jgi:hypothetical protein